MLSLRVATSCLVSVVLWGCGDDRPDHYVGPPLERKDMWAKPAPETAGPQTLTKGLACTQFEATAEFEDGHLHVDLKTDLPEDVEVSITVTRDYTEVGSEETYSLDYLDDDSKVADWTTGRDFDLSNTAALERFEEKREEWAAMGIDKEINRFSQAIEVWMLIRLSEPKTSGTCKLSESGDLEQTWEFKYPLAAKLKPVQTLNPEGLVKGDRFRLTQETPLMPSPDPADPMAALAQVVMVPAKSLVEVRSVSEVKGSRWYAVNVNKSRGWFNSTALIGQDLKRSK
ncbi:hypothetical protein [Enhygromyxa salina]|uniref:Uncharacterized protein n=1 Tax=Enhygromyxa salina TaxID=215803 RepID=A0A2S9Y0A4_9BACT|nr:hypothetical protein [Enhygromyxa salina]PRP98558.1 hypothetical protein ENSA7_65010 [Enhygromyxa salina]